MRANLEALELGERARILERDLARGLGPLAAGGERFDLVIADPPYEGGWLERLLACEALPGLLEAGGGPDHRALGARGERAGHPGAAAARQQALRRDGVRLVREHGKGGTMSEKRVAVYAASFDPITNGHLDLIERAAKLFDEVVVAVATNVEKSGGTFPVDERIALIRDAVTGMKNVRVDTIEGLLVDYLRRIGARIVIRGLRALADFEYEFEMALMNSHMFPEIETVFLMTSERWFYVSASRVRELVKFGADVTEFVPPEVAKRLRERIGPKKGR